eukprot:m.69517 g.69517  ORF g.69517 m.69517 type:complete len:105 (+) comp16781_c0_seq4:133-447(+)
MKRLLGSEEAIEVFFFKLADVTFAAGQAQRPRNEATNFRAPKMTATTELNRQAVSVTLTYFLLYTCKFSVSLHTPLSFSPLFNPTFPHTRLSLGPVRHLPSTQS